MPERFHRSSGLASARLHILDAWHRPFHYIRHPKGGALPISPAALCEIATADGPALFLADLRTQPRLAEAVLLFGKLFFTGNRVQRYVTLYKAYECVETAPAIAFAAVRHGLSHASSTLSRPRTVATLQGLFGSTQIDLGVHRHVRVFYRQLASLLVETDAKLYEAILAAEASLRRLRSRAEALHDWQVDGIPGIVEPIPSRSGSNGQE